MTLVINTNITSLIAQNNLTKTGDALQTTIQRLSSGLRVNSAADDASGYAIANRMDAQLRGMAVATRNTNDAISFSQTTSGALSQISNNLQRMRELAVQAANGSNSASDTALLNQEFNQLQTEVSRIQSSTSFNNMIVFQANNIVFQVGANTTSVNRVNMQGLPLTSTLTLGTQSITNGTTTSAIDDILGAALGAVGGPFDSPVGVQNAVTDAINSNEKLSFTVKNNMLTVLNAAAAISPNGEELKTALDALFDGVNTGSQVFGGFTIMGLSAADIATTGGGLGVPAPTSVIPGQTKALSAISAIDSALTAVNTASAVQGALQNRFTAVISNLTAFSQSQTAAKSRIVDADFAAETVKLSRNQILQQASTAMLAQANQIPSTVLSLLK